MNFIMHNHPLTHFGELSVEEFLRRYWQHKPLYAPQCLNRQLPEIDINDLAGLALEDEVESRLIDYRPEKTVNAWTLEHGPFSEQKLTNLPSSHWTLLIQAADIWIPEVSQFLDHFRFLPSWRLDDIMISCPTDGGGVGPHFDFYDVFLIQALGKRTWHLGPQCDDKTERIKDSPLNQIPDFEPEATYTTQPGDLLYVPAGKAHWGIAQGDDCVTLSVGFRAPSNREILSSYTDFLSENLRNSERYSDNSPAPAVNPGEIDDQVIMALREKILAMVDKPDSLISWFGQEMTEVKYDDIRPQDFHDLPSIDHQQLNNFLAVNALEIFPASRLAYKSYKGGARIFVDGEQYAVPLLTAEILCQKRYFRKGELSQLITDNQNIEHIDFFVALVNQGILLVAQD